MAQSRTSIAFPAIRLPVIKTAQKFNKILTVLFVRSLRSERGPRTIAETTTSPRLDPPPSVMRDINPIPFGDQLPDIRQHGLGCWLARKSLDFCRVKGYISLMSFSHSICTSRLPRQTTSARIQPL